MSTVRIHSKTRMRDRSSWDESEEKREHNLAILLTLAATSVFALAVFLGVVDPPSLHGRLGGWVGGGESVSGSGAEESLKIGGITLGTTSAALSREHPSLILTTESNGEQTGTFAKDGSLYRLWFLSPESGGRSYRLYYETTVAGQANDDIVASIAAKAGNPASSECDDKTPTVTECRYQWFPPDGISLNATLRMTADPYRASYMTEVKVVAIDTLLDGKRLRTKARKGGAR